MDSILHSQIIGEGTPFIVLHGFLGMSDNWKTLGKKFAELGYEVHLVDQRNHGRSFHSENFNYDLMADDLKTYCDHHQLNNMVLLGHSMGGKTAMEFAVRYNDLVKCLIVADIAPKSYPQHHQDILKALSGLNFSEIKTRGEADTYLGTYIRDMGTRQFLLKNLYWVEKGVLGLRINLPVLAKNITEVGRALTSNASYHGPTLFVRGGRSGYVDDLDEISIKKHFQNSEIATVGNVGHWLHAENPSKFLEIIANFLLNEV